MIPSCFTAGHVRVRIDDVRPIAQYLARVRKKTTVLDEVANLTTRHQKHFSRPTDISRLD